MHTFTPERELRDDGVLGSSSAQRVLWISRCLPREGPVIESTARHHRMTLPSRAVEAGAQLSQPTFRTLFCVVEYFLLETHTLNNLPAKEGIRSSRMLGFAPMGTSQTNAVIRRYSALVDGALLKVRSDRPEMAQYCTNMLQAATSNCACARLSVRNVGSNLATLARDLSPSWRYRSDPPVRRQ